MMKKLMKKYRTMHAMYQEDKDHISALRFDLKRKLDNGYISREKYKAKTIKVNRKSAKLKEIRNEFWEVKNRR